MENHCVLSKLHSDFVYVDFRMCEQNTLSKLYGNLLQTSSLWHRADRGTTRSARDPSSHTPAGAPQDDNIFLAGGFAPCTPIREREHRCLTIIVQFDILFFHIQVCQQSEERQSLSTFYYTAVYITSQDIYSSQTRQTQTAILIQKDCGFCVFVI